MTIYLDLVVGLNFLVDLMLLMGTNRLAGYPAEPGRAALGAVLGGVYGGACVIPGFRFLGNLLWRLVSLGMMSLLAFGAGPGTLRRGVLFTFLSMALGGMVLGMSNRGLGPLLLAAGAVCVMCVLGFRAGTGQHRYVKVRLRREGRSVELTALHDTGNTLRDPLTGERVLVTGPEAAGVLLGMGREELRDPAATLVRSGMPGLRLIPFRAVGNPRGMLLGIRVPEAQVNGNAGPVLVAFAPDGLGEGQGEFDALIGGVL